MPILLAPDTARALKSGLKDCESRSLWKDKFVFFDARFDESKQVALHLFCPLGRGDIKELRGVPRDDRNHVRATGWHKAAEGQGRQADKASAALTATQPFAATAPNAISRPRAWLGSIPAARRVIFQMTTSTRLLIGLANGVLENAGCSLHPLYGFGVIPGSALKAVARDAARVLKIVDDEFQRIFGNDPNEKKTLDQGSIAFLDAYAIVEAQQVDLEVDVVTPHFQEYYSGARDRHGNLLNAEAYDQEPPIPSPFPAVAARVPFEFPLIAHTRRIDDEQAAKDLATAVRCLREALSTSGVGAKTAAGYGRFELETLAPASRHDLFKPSASYVPPPPPPVPRTAAEKVLATWKGKDISIYLFGLLIKDLATIEDDVALTAVFDAIMPPAHLTNFRLANDYWKRFNNLPQDAGKKLLARMNRSLA